MIAFLKSIFLKDKSFKDAGLLVLRLGFGLSMAFLHGYGKLTGGPELWEKLGGSMQNFGIGFMPTFWGFMAMFAEFFASLALILGIAFRPAAGLLIITMLVASIRHLSLPAGTEGAGIGGAAHALEFLAVYITLYLSGPGKYTLTGLFKNNK